MSKPDEMSILVSPLAVSLKVERARNRLLLDFSNERMGGAFPLKKGQEIVIRCEAGTKRVEVLIRTVTP